MSGRITVVVHGGAGASKEAEDGCLQAAQAALGILRQDGTAIDAVVNAVTCLEDDGRFNAGSGSIVGLDGSTVEMDASVMDSEGKLGAVAGIRQVRNPVQVARAVCETPHHLLCGEGALRFARRLGYQPYEHTSARAIAEHRDLLGKLVAGEQLLPGVNDAAFLRYWNYERNNTLCTSNACDTVGAVARDAAGHFAAAGSTGGSAPALLGRVGDTPLIGSGFFAGPFGAVAATGIGEHIMRHVLAYTVYQWLAAGLPLQAALRRGVALFPPAVDIGLIAVTADEAGYDSNRAMPVIVRNG